MGELADSMTGLRHLPIERGLVAHGRPVLEGGTEAIAAPLDSFAGDDLHA
jgi:hypothetical protein